MKSAWTVYPSPTAESSNSLFLADSSFLLWNKAPLGHRPGFRSWSQVLWGVCVHTLMKLILRDWMGPGPLWGKHLYIRAYTRDKKIMAIQIRFLRAVLPSSLQRSQEEASKGSLWLTRNRLVTSSIQANSAECASQGGTKGTDLYTLWLICNLQ